jgi:hypothetical protein
MPSGLLVSLRQRARVAFAGLDAKSLVAALVSIVIAGACFAFPALAFVLGLVVFATLSRSHSIPD